MSRVIEYDADDISRLWLLILSILVLALTTGWYLLFHGYFDHAPFEIKQLEWSPYGPRRVALVAERSDHSARGSDEYFVLVASHIPSARELRRTYYSDDVIFRAPGNCLNVHWTDPHGITISCTVGYTDSLYAGGIAAQKHKADDVAVTYVNIPPSNRN